MTVPPGYTIESVDVGYAYEDMQPGVVCDRCKVSVIAEFSIDLRAAVLAVWDHEASIHGRPRP